jgi:hypothetical protein
MTLVMSFYDPFKAFIYLSNRCDVVPLRIQEKNLTILHLS